MTNLNGPIMPEPVWRRNREDNNHLDGTRVYAPEDVPKAYAAGVKDGAEALATQVFVLLQTGKRTEAMVVLAGYATGLFRPCKDWLTEPPRS